MPDNIIKIRDKRKIDPITGQKIADTQRIHGNISYSNLKTLVEKANEHGVDPYTVLAIGLQETGLGRADANNIFQMAQNTVHYNEMWNDPFGAPIRLMKEKFDKAKKLGKTSDEDIIQAWNGYGKVGGPGSSTTKLYGIDVSKTPIDMKENPVYAKRIINLRDSVVRKNQDIIKYIEETGRMKQISKQPEVPQLKCGGKVKGKKKMEDGGLKEDSDLDINKLAGSLTNIVGNKVVEILEGAQKSYTDPRENPAETMLQNDNLGVAGDVAGSTLKGAAKGLATAGPVGAIVGGATGLLTSGIKNIIGAKKRREERELATEKWSNNWASKTAGNYSNASYKEGGLKTKLASGGKVTGPGTAKSDSIEKNVPDGSFVVPAENASKALDLGKEYLGWDEDEKTGNIGGTKVNVSNGEVIFTPKEVNTLLYYGIDLNSLAPKAENKIEEGGSYADGSLPEKLSSIADKDSFLDAYISEYPGTTDEDALNAWNGLHPENADDSTEHQTEQPEKSFMSKLENVVPEIAGLVQSAAGLSGIIKAGRMPDINVSEELKALAADQRKEAEYGLEPGAKTAMKIASERQRRNATNALIARGGGSGELMSNLQGILSTSINEGFKTELADAAEKSRKKTELINTRLNIGAQEFYSKRFQLENWKEMQTLNANLLQAGIANIVGARKLKAEMDAIKKAGNSKIDLTQFTK